MFWMRVKDWSQLSWCCHSLCKWFKIATPVSLKCSCNHKWLMSTGYFNFWTLKMRMVRPTILPCMRSFSKDSDPFYLLVSSESRCVTAELWRLHVPSRLTERFEATGQAKKMWIFTFLSQKAVSVVKGLNNTWEHKPWHAMFRSWSWFRVFLISLA